MAWEVWWALVLGFAISAIVQAWVPRERVERALSGGGPRSIAMGHRLGSGVLVVLVCGDRDRKVAVSEGRQRGQRAGVSVRLDEPRVGAGPRSVGADRLAVHGRRIRRRNRDDRADDGAAAPVRQPPAGGAGPRARAGGRQRTPAPRRRLGAELAPAADIAGRRGRMWRTTSGATGRCCGRRSRSASCSPGSSRSSATGSSNRCSSTTPRSRSRRSRTSCRPRDRRAQLRLLGRQRSAGGGPVVRRDQFRRRARVPVRRPDRAADPRDLPQVLRRLRTRCGSPR